MRLEARLGTADAVTIGLSSMIGAGLFAAFAPAASRAGWNLVPALLLAALVAFCNATSSAALAARHPAAGGAYVYGRERLGPNWGYLAGWGFVTGKTASCAAMALTAANYLVPEHPHVAAVVFVLLLTGTNYVGITRTARLARMLLGVTLTGVAVALVAIWFPDRTPPLLPGTTNLPRGTELRWGGLWGITGAAGLLFFAFAGYARIATLGEEVRAPERTIPRAVPIALGAVVVLYLVVGVTLLGALGPAELARSTAPLAEAVRGGPLPWLAPAARLAAGTAALGALLALLAGVGRTALAMARERDLPRWLNRVHPRFGTPHHAELGVAAVVAVLVLAGDLRSVIGFSSFGVLVYYAVANAAAWRLPRDHRWFPRALPAAGLLGCAVLAFSLPWQAVVAGVGCFLVGALFRLQRKLLPNPLGGRVGPS
ncbi:amino acid permease [Actinopolyspora erythraea]|uniref:Amino acid permease n=1 Tax=Actinopolyspora erythraea TaxID=414996 RepID=A0A099D9X7_9ACTN|nr:amino acid permease [Actinopolyspora erythraea]KGI82889.1 transporter [Actinopolyspora erythraea]